MAEAEKNDAVGRAVLATLFTVFLHSWVPVGLGVFLAFGAPRFENHFAESGVAVPAIAGRVFELSQRFRADWVKFTIVACLLLAIDGVLLFMLRRSLGRIAAALLSGLIIVAEIGAAAVCVLGVLVPFWNQREQAAIPTRPAAVARTCSLPERPDLAGRHDLYYK